MRRVKSLCRGTSLVCARGAKSLQGAWRDGGQQLYTVAGRDVVCDVCSIRLVALTGKRDHLDGSFATGHRVDPGFSEGGGGGGVL